MTKQLNNVTDRPVPARRDPSGGQEFEILQRAIEPLFPGIRIVLDPRQIARNTAPRILDRFVDCRAVGLFETVFHIPDGLGDRGGESGH